VAGTFGVELRVRDLLLAADYEVSRARHGRIRSHERTAHMEVAGSAVRIIC